MVTLTGNVPREATLPPLLDAEIEFFNQQNGRSLRRKEATPGLRSAFVRGEEGLRVLTIGMVIEERQM